MLARREGFWCRVKVAGSTGWGWWKEVELCDVVCGAAARLEKLDRIEIWNFGICARMMALTIIFFEKYLQIATRVRARSYLGAEMCVKLSCIPVFVHPSWRQVVLAG